VGVDDYTFASGPRKRSGSSSLQADSRKDDFAHGAVTRFLLFAGAKAGHQINLNAEGEWRNQGIV
jgi:hypothetical protein